MKRLTFILLAGLFCGTASAYKIEGRVTGVSDADSTQLMLMLAKGGSGRSIQIQTIRDGYFCFQGDDLPDGLNEMGVSVRDGGCSQTLWVTNASVVNLTGDVSEPAAWGVESTEPEQQIEKEILAVSLDDLHALTESYEGYQKYKDSTWQVGLERLWPVYMKYPNSAAVQNDFSFYVQVKAVPQQKLQWMYDQLTPQNKASLEGEAIAFALKNIQPVQEGDPYADFEAVDLGGNPHKLSDYAGKGKYVLLDFWSSGCGPCHAAFPEMKELYGKYKDRLEIVGINLDGQRIMWEGTSARYAFPWVDISDGKGRYGAAYALYGVQGMPCYVVISPEGTIASIWMGFGKGVFEERIGKLIDNQ